ncbi:c-type cytochrome [Alteraurantiacibacter aquimixticola]|uniref:Cytochrome c n=1 Tax=Alteraurantiacibacter aquimixticola TaxID=2489173 RepID=A0A4V4U8Q5_9SPHN|nr:cytochrome c [Alteraurantiacibacter aquimixticola]TIX50947.1 cytochrome c [Alteraurantiacibacter aquimixticola]
MSIRLTLGTLAASTLLLGVAAAREPVRDIERADLPGQQVFARQCAPCHGTGPGDDGSPMLPGTAALAAKYEGALPAALELRSDLSAPVLTLFVRRGSGAMPMFRKAELTDAQIEELAAYLAATAALNTPATD